MLLNIDSLSGSVPKTAITTDNIMIELSDAGKTRSEMLLCGVHALYSTTI